MINTTFFIECTAEGGQAAGTCAQGFGICCVFTSECNNEISFTDVNHNVSYIRNEGYPSAIIEKTSCKYRILKSDDCKTYHFVQGDIYHVFLCIFLVVCTLRLDFEIFTLLAGTGSLDKEAACQDTLTVTGVLKFIEF